MFLTQSWYIHIILYNSYGKNKKSVVCASHSPDVKPGLKEVENNTKYSITQSLDSKPGHSILKFTTSAAPSSC